MVIILYREDFIYYFRLYLSKPFGAVPNSLILVPQGRQLTIKAIALVRKVAEALSLIRHNHKRRTVVKSDFVDIIIYKEKPDIMAGQNFTEENGSVFVPESVMKTLPNTDDKISLQVSGVY